MLGTPYFEQGGVSIYHGDCRDLLPLLPEPDLLLADPPYGIRLATNYSHRTALAVSGNFPPIYGDADPFDPTHLLRYRRAILFGANHYAAALPPSNAWLVWDKLAGLTSKRVLGFNNNGDAELAWTNLPGPVRLIPHRWMGMLKGSEHAQRRVHPTQKPVALMAAILELFTRPGDLVIDPYAGSGPVLLAAAEMGRRAIGIEIEERYCEVAAERLRKAAAA